MTEKESAAIKVRFERHDKRIGILEYKLHAAQEALNARKAWMGSVEARLAVLERRNGQDGASRRCD